MGRFDPLTRRDRNGVDEISYMAGERMGDPQQTVREFETGATRSADNGKPDYEGYLSPLVISAFGDYMTKHRHQADGTLRASDNWQRGIPRDAYIKSLFRHFIDLWKIHRMGHANDHENKPVTIEDTLAALMFNVQGYFHEYLKAGLALASEKGQSAANRIGGEVIDNDGNRYFPQPTTLSENTATDPHAPRTAIPEHPRGGVMLEQLRAGGCPDAVAKLIVRGTTFAPSAPFSDRPKFVYIAGPMRGIKDFNFPAFDKARDVMLAQGYNVISPADIDRADFSKTPPENHQAEFAFRDFWSLYFLKQQGHKENGVVLLPGWKKSTGASGEFFMSRWLGLQFYVIWNRSTTNDIVRQDTDSLVQDYALANVTVR